VVWEIAEDMFNDGHKRKDIIAACVATGIAFLYGADAISKMVRNAKK
jgi:hypothetical protein